LKEHFKKFDASNVQVPAEIENLKQIVELREQEITDLRHQVESNPLLAERHAKVIQLESLLRQNGQSQMYKTLESICGHLESVMRGID
jgi:predicted component of type VI protein secretion system